jgi:hypothetical protein
LDLDYRDEEFWYNAALEKDLLDEYNNLVGRRIASSADSNPTHQRLLMINFELQKLRLDDEDLD